MHSFIYSRKAMLTCILLTLGLFSSTTGYSQCDQCPGNTPPVLEVDGSTTDFPTVDFDCIESDPVLTPELPITEASDDCTALSDVDVVISDDSPGVLTTGCIMLVTRTYSLTDECGEETIITETWTYKPDDIKPTFGFVPFGETHSCIEDVPDPVDLTWTDGCDGTGTVSPTITNNPIDPCTGGTIVRFWTYTNGCGQSVNHTQNITINPEIALSFSSLPADITVGCGDPLPPMEDLTYTNGESTASCEETGSVSPVESGTLDACGDVITRTWDFTSACGENVNHVQTITLEDNDPPVLDTPPADVTILCIGDIPPTEDVMWTDACDGSGIAMMTETDNTAGCAGGTIERLFEYTDVCGNPVSHTQIITLEPNEPAVLDTPPADITITCIADLPPTEDVMWTDACDGTGLATITEMDNTSGCAGGTIERLIEYTDTCGDAVSHTQIITLEANEPPVLDTPPADITIVCIDDLPPTEDVMWTDACDGTGIATVAETDNTAGCAGGTIERLIEFTDACGDAVSHTQIITVEPYPNIDWITSLAADISISCGDVLPISEHLDYSNGLSGSCEVSGTISSTDSGTLNQCGDQITRTWTVPEDAANCINEITHSITITLEDSGMPMFVNLPAAAVEVACTTDIPAAQDLEWEDDCDGTGTVPFVEIGSPDLCTGGDITRTWEFTDACGNGPITFTQVYTITEPEFTTCDDGDSCTENDMVKLDCEGNICEACMGTPTDCSGDVTYTVCDDNDPCTENDMLGTACDGTICEPCMGIPVATCSGTVPNEILPCDDGDPCTINDMMEVDGCDMVTECVPCAGTPDPTPDPTPPTGNIGCVDESTTLTLTGCSGTVTWYDAPGGSQLHVGDSFDTPVLSGDISYYVTCSIAGCESNPVEVAVTVLTPTPINISGDDMICAGQETITLTADSGYDSYDWGAGAGPDETLDVTAAGTYSVTATDSNGCTVENSIEIMEADTPVVDITGSLSYCIGFATTIEATAGFDSYAWSPNGETTNTVDANSAGTYTVTVTNSDGCTAETSVEIIEADGLMPEITGDLIYCEGMSTDLSVGSGYANIEWAPNGETTETITANSPGTYTVTVSDADGCSGTAEVEVMENPNPTPTITGDVLICTDGMVTLSADSGFDSYEWNDGSGGQNLDITGPGSYSVTVTDANGCTGTDEFTVDPAPDPVVDITGDLTVCPGGGDIVTLTATAGFDAYAWSDGSTTTNTLDTAAPGTYTVTVTDANGCTGTASTDITEDTPPDVMIDGTLQFCLGNSTTLTATSGLASYEWTNGETTESVDASTPGTYTVTVTDINGCTNTASVDVIELTELMPEIVGDLDICPGGAEDVTLMTMGTFETYDWGSGPSTDNSLTVNMPGDYSVTVTDINGCSGNSTVTIVENVVDVAAITGGPNFCTGTSLDLTVTGNFDTYSWSNGGSGGVLSVDMEGIYSVTATDINGCTNTAEIEVFEIPDPTVDVTGDLTVCPGGSDMVTLTATAGLDNYAWSNGDSGSNEITVSAAGPYTVTVTDSNGCTNTAMVEILEDTPPDVTIDGNEIFCLDFTTTLTATDGLVDYVWSTGETTNVIEADASGTYTVTVTDTNGCTNTASIDVTQLTELMPEIEGDLDICPDGAEDVVLTVNGAFDMFDWGSGPGTDNTLTVNGAGDYFVTVTDANGCTGNSSITITENVVDVVTISGGPNFCTGTTLGLSADGMFDSYSWSNGNNQASIGVSTPGIYTVTATDINGCTNTAEIEIFEIPDPTVDVTGDLLLCPGGSDMVTLTATAGLDNYAWSNGDNGSNEITVGAVGTYTVTVTDTNGCTNTASVDVIEDTPPDVTIDGSLVFCTGFSTTLTATAGLPGYEWSTGDMSNTIDVSTSGTYTVTVTDDDGCTNTASFDVTELTELMPIILGDLDICPDGAETVTLTVDGTYVSYEWGTDGSGTDATLDVSAAGTYSVTVTDTNGCSGNSTVTVIENIVGDVTIEGPDSFCAGLSAGLTATAGWSSYSWSNGTNGFFNDVDMPGLYTVTVTDDNGCTNTAEFNIIETEIPTPAITGDFDLCEGDTETIDVGMWADIAWSTGDTGSTIDVMTAGDYTATVTDDNGCTNSVTVTVVVNPLPTPTVTGDFTFCVAGTTTLTLEGTYSDIQWSNGETASSIEVGTYEDFTVTVTDANGCTNSTTVTTELQDGLFPEIMGPDLVCTGSTIELDAGDYTLYEWNDGTTTNPLEVTGTGTFSVTVTDAGQCTGVATFFVDEAAPEPVEINGNEWYCAGLSTEITATGNHVAYEWSTGEASSSIDVTSEGTYTVTATDANGCVATNEIEIIEQPNPEPTLDGIPMFCPDSETVIGVAEPFTSYEWSNGETSQEIFVSTEGTFSVTVTDDNGCTGVQMTEVSVFDEVIPGIRGPQVFCIDGFTEIFADIEYASYEWSTGETTEGITVSIEGIYSLTVTDENGCTGSSQIEVIEQDQLYPEITSVGQFCTGNEGFLNAGSGYIIYEWDDSNNSDSQTISVDQGGIYSVTVTDAFGCTGTSAFEIIETPPPFVEITGDIELCDGESTELFATGGFDSYMWSASGDGESIEVDEAGTYTVTVFDENGCSASANIFVDVFELPEPELWGNDIVCVGYTNTFEVVQEFEEYLWMTGETTQSIEYGGTDEISVIVTDENGCVGSASTFQSTHPENLVEIAGSTNYCAGGTTTLDAGLWIDYIWEGPVFGYDQYLDAPIEGEYTVYVTDFNGCTSSSSVYVEEGSELFPNVTGNFEFCTGGSAILNAGVFDSYEWSGPETGNEQILEVTTPGNYTLLVSQGTCVGEVEFEVEEFVAPIATIDGGLSICNGQATVLTTQASTSIAWSNGGTAESIVVDQAGIYSVTITDTNGCTGVSSVEITQADDPTVQISGDGFYCPGSSTTLVAGVFESYAWSNGETTQSIVVGTPGTVSVTVTDAGGCMGIGMMDVVEIVEAPVVISGSTSFCAGSSTTFDAGTGYTDYSWSNGETTQTIMVEDAGSYTVTVTTAGGCVLTETVNASIETSLTFEILGNTNICAGATTTLDAGNFSSYTWSTPEGPFNTQTIEVSTPGVYMVTVDDGNGCSGENSITLAEIIINEPSIAGITSICEDAETTLSVEDNYSTYNWSNGSTTASTNVSNAGTYSLTVTNAEGCEATTSVDIEIQDAPTPVILGPASFCPGSTTTLDAGEYESYLWSTGGTTQTIEIGVAGDVSVTVTDINGCEGFTSTTLTTNETENPQIAGSTTFCTSSSTTLELLGTWATAEWSTGDTGTTIEVSIEGAYGVTVTDAQGCTSMSTVSITEESTLDVNVVSDSDIICGNSTSNLSAGNFFETYEWSNGETTSSIDVTIEGTYSVTVTDAGGCTGEGSVDVNDGTFFLPTLSGDIPLCGDEEVTLGYVQAYSSQIWSTGEDTQFIDVSDPGTYGITVTNSVGCTAESSFDVVQDNIVPPVIEGGPQMCEGSSITLSAPGYEAYIWSTPGQFTESLEITEPGTYTVTVTNAAGCDATGSITITPYAESTMSIAGSTSFCAGSSTTLSLGDEWTNVEWSNGETSNVITISDEGPISVTALDENGCEAFAEATISLDSELMPQIVGDSNVCEGEVVILDAGEGYGFYEWSTGENSQTIEVSEAGTYTVSVIDQSGQCSGDGSFDVAMVSIVEPAINGPTTACPTENIILSVAGTYASYEWSTGSIEPMITVTGGGTYNVTVTNTEGCAANAVLEITNEEIPTYEIDALECSADGDEYSVLLTTTAITVSNDLGLNNEEVAPGQFLISGIEDGQVVNITISNGLTSCDEVIEITPPNCECQALVDAGVDQALDCIITEVEIGGTGTSTGPEFTYEWTDPNGVVISDETTAIATEGGTYTLVVTDTGMDCSVSDVVFVNTPTLPSPSINGEDEICEGTSTTLEVAQPYSSYEWSTGASTSSIDVDEAGDYSVTITDAAGCEGIASFTVDVIEIPNITITDRFCNEDEDMYTVIFTTDADNYEINLPLTVEDLGDGSYSVSGIDLADVLSISASNSSIDCSDTVDVTAPNCQCPAIADAGEGQTLDCIGTTITLGGAGTTTGNEFTYEWLDPNGSVISTEATAEATIEGSYTLIVTDNDMDCSDSDNVLIELPALPEPTISGDEMVCEGTTATLTVDQTFDAYSWSNGDTTASIDVDESGEYTATVTDATGCEGIATFTVEVIEIPSVTITDRFCNEDEDMYTVIFTTDADNYEINLPNNVEDLGDGSYSISGIAIADAVTITVSNSDLDCNDSLEVSPPNCQCPAIADAGEVQTLDCTGGAVTLGGAGTTTGAEFTYEWLDADGTVISTEATTEVTIEGTYTLIVTDNDIDCTASDNVLVELPALPEPTITGVDEICDLESTTLTADANGGEGPWTYAWSTGNTTNAIDVSEAGIYIVSVTDAAGCEGIESFTLTVVDAPIITLIDRFCNDDADEYTVIFETDADNYEIDLSNDIEDLGDGTYSVSGIDIGTVLNITASNSALECDNSLQVTPPNCFCEVEANAGEPQMLTCEITEVTLGSDLTTTGNDIEITWTNPAGDEISNEQYVDVSEPGVYTIQVYDVIEDCFEISTVEVTQEDGEPIAIILSDTQNIIDCQLLAIDLYVNPEANTNYIWTVEETETNGTNITVEIDGEIILTAINTITGCTSLDTIMIEDMQAYPAIFLEDPLALDCNNDEVLIGTSTQNFNTDIVVEWFDADGQMLMTENDSISVTEPGWYFIQATDPENGCSNIDSVQVLEFIFEPEIYAGEDMLIPCDETSLTLDALNLSIDSDRDFVFSWTTETGNIVFGENQLNPVVNQDGEYIVEILDVLSGCIATDAIMIETDENKPYGIESIIQDPFCSNEEGGSIQVTGVLGGDGPYTSLLNGNAGDQDGIFENLGVGTYELLIEDMNGCVHDTIIEISFENEVSLNANPPVLELDDGGSEEVELITNLLDSEISEIVWNDTEGVSCTDCLNPIITSDINRDYVITIYDQNGCADTTTIRVLVELEALAVAPNIITPNSEAETDIANKRFTIYTHPNIEIIEELHIYDRWGELMFSNFDFQPNRPSLGWNGKFKGEYVVPGVYVYIATYRTKWGETGIIKGDVTIAL